MCTQMCINIHTASHLPSQWNGFKFFTPDTPSNIGEEGIQAIIDHCGYISIYIYIYIYIHIYIYISLYTYTYIYI
jgi:hypothetical protein